MKNVFAIVAMALCITFTTGCSEDSSTGNTPNTTTGGALSAKMNGAAWNADVSVMAVKTANNTITINAMKGLQNRETLMLTFMNATGTGDHTMTMYGVGTSANFSRLTPQESYTSLDANSGTAKITKLTDSRIEGTFTVTVKQGQSGNGVINFTEGTFGADLK